MNHRVRPSRLFYGVGVVMMLAAILIIVINVLVTINQVNLQKRLIKVPGINTVVIEETGDYIVYYEPRVTFEGEKYNTSQMNLPEIRVKMNRLRSEEDYPFQVAEDDGVNFIFFDTGNPVIRFRVDEPGAFVFDINYVTNEGPDVILNVTKDIVDDLNRKLRQSVYLGFAFILVGVLGIIATFLSRLWFMKRMYDDKKFKEKI